MNAELVAAGLEGGRRSGAGWVARCPAHDDTHPSLSVSDGDAGVVVVHCHGGCSQGDVIAALRARGLWSPNGGGNGTRRPRPAPARDAGECLMPVPEGAADPPETHPGLGAPAARWPYRDADGGVLGYVCRFDGDGGKTIRPLTYWRCDGHVVWAWKIWPTPRPLCGLDRLARRPDAPVIVTEGEKAAQAAHVMLPDMVAVTSPGGSSAAGKADWAPLRGRRVVIWPDADGPGRRYAADAARLARAAGAAEVAAAAVPDDVPAGWDLGDPLPPGWTPATVRERIAAAPVAAEAAADQAVMRCVADVPAEDVTWLWSPYLPRGKMSLLVGDPAAGKTYLALAIATTVTTGAPWPGKTDRHDPESILYLTAEDGVADTIRPTLDLLGADTRRVHVLDGRRDDRGRCVPVTLADVDVIEEAMRRVRPALMVIDPIQGYLGAGVDMHRANETRPLLSALGGLAERHRCAVLVIAHRPKSGAGRAVLSALGSVDFAAAARSILLAGRDPRDPARRAVVPIKASLGPEGPAQGYVIDAHGLGWTGQSDLTAADVLAGDSDGKSSKRDTAVEFLSEYLGEGPRPAREVYVAAEAAGISDATLRRAKGPAGVTTTRRGGIAGAGEWVWAVRCPDSQLGRLSDSEGVCGEKNVTPARDNSDSAKMATLFPPGTAGHLSPPAWEVPL